MSSDQSYSTLCTVRIKDGKKVLKIYDTVDFSDGLQPFGEGEELALTIETAGRKKTRAQEKFFHGPVLKALIRLGWRKQEAKDMLCLRFIPDEIRLPDGSFVRVPGHTSKLKVEEYSELIESSIQLAAEMGEVVEDAAEWRAKHRRAA